MRRPVLIAAAGVVTLVAAGVAIGVTRSGGDEFAVRSTTLTVPGVPESGRPVALDATLFLPQTTTARPAVLLAHGFGGSKEDLADQARSLAGHGYVVMTWTARGFGLSGGLIHLDAPDYEVADARRLVDYLATRPEVRLDGPGDPRIGIAGGSYGGAISLLLAGYDRRIDAIAPQITWNELGNAIFPQSLAGAAAQGDASGQPAPAGTGVFKKGWAGVFLGPRAIPGQGIPGEAVGASPPAGASPAGASTSGASAAGASAAGASTAGPGASVPGSIGSSSITSGSVGPDLIGTPACGRLAPDVCSAYQAVAASGRPTAAMLGLLAASSPARILDRITAPTLLIQGEADSLFPLSEGNANAAGIAAHGTPVKVVWEGGGHDGGLDESVRLQALTTAWFDHYLGQGVGAASAPDTRFEVTVPAAAISSQDSNPAPQIRGRADIPGVTGPATDGQQEPPGAAQQRFALHGAEQVAVSPAGGTPAALSSLPGLGTALTRAASSLGGAGSLSALPGQTAAFETDPLPAGVPVVGASSVQLTVGSTAKDATLFVSLQDVSPSGTVTLPNGLVSPVYLADLSKGSANGSANGSQNGTANGSTNAVTVTVRLPAIVRDVAAGHRLRVVVSTTDQAYAVPTDPRQYRIALAAGSGLTVAGVALTVLDAGGLSTLLPWAVALAGIAVLLALFAFWSRRRTGRDKPLPDLAAVPLRIDGLGKAYSDGYRAVTDVSFTVETGWVLGLLGPNGAGKTTTLRMLMGLIRPSEGEIRIFGHRITPGAPVLSRVGSFVEGPGFLPHVSGLDNLRLYWQATGRPMAEAHLDDALEVAGLADDVRRKVKTYSQGMRQRLAIAQAMLGLPDLLLLDEPTNGLDPPQIREMREVLSRYAATGRTVVVSSHLLAEVEQTCSHVVVMHQGRLVAQGPVAELVGTATTLVLDVDDPVRAARVAAGVDGARDIETTPGGLVLKLVGTPRGELVRALVDAGVDVDRIAPQRGLEEAFLALVGES